MLYRTISSFREYLLIHQDQHFVEYFSRQADGNWLLREYSDDNALIVIETLNFEISIAELYAPLSED